jgi:phosphatidylcholine synthase
VDRSPQGAAQFRRVRDLIGSMPLNLVLAWLVHLYTALGAVIAFATVFCIEQKLFQEAFWLMFLAVAVDATDGTLARALRVKELIPWFDGDRLEDIVDYANYVIVPAFFLVRADVLPRQDALWLAALPLLASAYGFSQKEAKTADHYFRGFPSYWNVVVFYFYVLQTPHWMNAFAVIILSILVFVPVKYIYPSRSPLYRGLTNGLGILWGLSLSLIIHSLPEPRRTLVLASLAFPIYYTLLSLWLEVRRVGL